MNRRNSRGEVAVGDEGSGVNSPDQKVRDDVFFLFCFVIRSCFECGGCVDSYSSLHLFRFQMTKNPSFFLGSILLLFCNPTVILGCICGWRFLQCDFGVYPLHFLRRPLISITNLIIMKGSRDFYILNYWQNLTFSLTQFWF